MDYVYLDFKQSEIGVKLFIVSTTTQGTFNSLLSPSPKTKHCSGTPPQIYLPPTWYDKLHTGLMTANATTTYAIRLEAITIVIHDLQLYDLAIKLRIEHEDIQKKFLFWPGEPWIIF